MSCSTPPVTQPIQTLPPASFTFLAVSTWRQPRKGWDVLLRAYLEEFAAAEDTLLVIHTRDAPDGIEGIMRDIEQIRSETRTRHGLPRIHLSTKKLPTRHMPSLYKACDAFVLASRGEGWGRPYMEAMAMGLPTIGTGWGGNTDFMNTANSYLIDHTPVDMHDGPGHRWAEPSVDHLRELLRHVATDTADARSRAHRASTEIRGRYSASKILDGLLSDAPRG